MVRWSNLLLGTNHLMEVIGYFVHEFSTLIAYLCSRTSVFTDKFTQELGSCWCRLFTSWFCFRSFGKIVYTNNDMFDTRTHQLSIRSKDLRQFAICVIIFEETLMLFISCFTSFDIVRSLWHLATSLMIVYQ